MKLYLTQTCPMVPAIVGTLNQYQVAYTPLDIDDDHSARQQLQSITGGDLSVPTLVLPDGKTLIEPTVSELEMAMLSAGLIDKVNSSPSSPSVRQMVGVLIGVFANLMIFSVAVMIGQQLELLVSTGWLIVGLLWMGVVWMIIGRLPVLRSRLAILRKGLQHPVIQIVQMFIYSAAIGLVASQLADNKPVLVWVILVGIVLPIGVLLSRLFGRDTQNYQQTIQQWKGRLGWIVLIGFVIMALLTASFQYEWTTVIALSFIPTVCLTFIFSCLSIWTQQQTIPLIKGFIYPIIGLILLLLFI